MDVIVVWGAVGLVYKICHNIRLCQGKNNIYELYLGYFNYLMADKKKRDASRAPLYLLNES